MRVSIDIKYKVGDWLRFSNMSVKVVGISLKFNNKGEFVKHRYDCEFQNIYGQWVPFVCDEDMLKKGFN